MTDLILTGASRGIGAALAAALAADPAWRVFPVVRTAADLPRTTTADLAQPASARAAGEALAAQVEPGAVLVHMAGVWPARRELVDGFERAYATHCLGPLALQAPLLASGRVARVLVIGAGLMVKGRFRPDRTPTGADFSSVRTYCTTKLAQAVVMRAEARRWPSVDFAVVHPGVVQTDLGDRGGPLGWLLRRVKRSWEAPEVCAARLVRLLAVPRWAPAPGEATWYFEEEAQPWPPQADAAAAAVAEALP